MLEKHVHFVVKYTIEKFDHWPRVVSEVLNGFDFMWLRMLLKPF